tara:strand:- start:1109 stop:1426 length:318 start_codon:yes stop_codon:yes gene_type:complete
MKITKSRLKEIIKEEVVKIFEAKQKDEEVSGVKVVEEEEELDETSMMGGLPVGSVAGHSGASKKEEKKKKKEFPDLTGDGKVTKADVLKGRGVELKEDGWDDPHV